MSKGFELRIFFTYHKKIQVQNNYIKLVILTKLKKKGYQRKREKYMLKVKYREKKSNAYHVEFILTQSRPREKREGRKVGFEFLPRTKFYIRKSRLLYKIKRGEKMIYWS